MHGLKEPLSVIEALEIISKIHIRKCKFLLSFLFHYEYKIKRLKTGL